jgi:hypothetical protein
MPCPVRADPEGAEAQPAATLRELDISKDQPVAT